MYMYLSAPALLICEQWRDGLCHPFLVEVAAGEDEEGENDVEEDVFAHPRVSVLEVGDKNKAGKRKQIVEGDEMQPSSNTSWVTL